MSQPAAEVDLTVADVDRLIAMQHPGLRGRLHQAAHGWDNEVFRLGEDLAVRLPRREAAARLIEHEQRWLPELGPRLPVPTPVPVAVGRPQGHYRWSWSIVPWFDGRRLIDLAPHDRDRFAEELAAVLAALHVAAPPDAPHNPVRGVPLHERDAVVRARLMELPELVSVWTDSVSAPEWDRGPVWLHGDLHPANVIAGETGLAAVIDFGDLCLGDPAGDLAVAWTTFTDAGRRRFVSALGERYDDATWRRARGWAVSLATLMRDSPDPGMRAMSSHTVGQLLI